VAFLALGVGVLFAKGKGCFGVVELQAAGEVLGRMAVIAGARAGGRMKLVFVDVRMAGVAEVPGGRVAENEARLGFRWPGRQGLGRRSMALRTIEGGMLAIKLVAGLRVVEVGPLLPVGSRVALSAALSEKGFENWVWWTFLWQSTQKPAFFEGKWKTWAFPVPWQSLHAIPLCLPSSAKRVLEWSKNLSFREIFQPESMWHSVQALACIAGEKVFLWGVAWQFSQVLVRSAGHAYCLAAAGDLDPAGVWHLEQASSSCLPRIG
jgi:hypothetical protein